MRKGAKFAKISIAKIYIASFYPALINPHKVSFFLVHMVDEITADTPCDVPEKALIYASKLSLIVSKGGPNSADWKLWVEVA